MRNFIKLKSIKRFANLSMAKKSRREIYNFLTELQS